MNYQSEQINELFTALAKAQGEKDWLSESRIAPKIARMFQTRQKKYNGVVERFFSKVCYGFSDCWFWNGYIDEIGYGRFGKYEGENKAHRVSWKLHKGDIPDGMKVLHKCDIRNCVNPDHLFLGTQKENVRDMFSKGRHHSSRAGKGEKNHMSKLTSEKVIQMRNIYSKGGISFENLSKQFNISAMTAYRAVSKQSWSHI